MKLDTKLNIINWLVSVKNFRDFKPNKPNKLLSNNYFLFFLFFKYLILKDVCFLNFKVLIQKYNLNLYLNIIECRFYYLFFFIIIRNKLYDFITFFYQNILEYNNRNYIKSYKYIFFYNNYIYLNIYLLKYLQIFIIKFNKYNYYKCIKIYNNFFFYKEFKLKVDYNSFFLYRRYIEYFRLSKYNEYLSNNILFNKYPKLKYILHVFFSNYKKFNFTYRKSIIMNFFNIYKLKNSKFKDFDKYKLNLNNKRYNVNNNIILIRSLNLSNFLYLKLDNNFLYLKLNNNNFIKFLDITQNSLYIKIYNIFIIFISIYIAYTTYKVHHIFILRYKQIRRLKCRHIIALHWKYNKSKYYFLPYIFKIFYKFFTYNIFNIPNIINYGFLSYYFLENNTYLKNYIKKKILLYRITNIIIIEYISILFDCLHWDIDLEAHKFKSFSQPDILKMWQININKHLSKKQKLIAPINPNIFDSKNKSIQSFISLDFLPKDHFRINNLFIFLWKFIYKWSIVLFTDILHITRNNKGFRNIFFNYKYSFEFISWEIFNSNNNNYILNKYFLKFNYILKIIKIENIITLFLSKYNNNILQYITKYTKDYFINLSFIYIFLRDLYILILSKKNKIKKIKYLILQKKFIVNKYNFYYYKFFYWQLNSFLSLQRFWLFYNKYKIYYKDYTFYH